MKETKDFSKIIEVEKEGIITPGESITTLDDNIDFLISEGCIKKRTDALAEQICKDYKEDIYGVVILRGSVFFSADLMRSIYRRSGKNVIYETMQVESYEGTKSTGNIKIVKDVGNIADRDVLIIEDIVDTGNTLSFLTSYFINEKKARSVRTCCLLDKPVRRETEVDVHYVGFTIPNLFVIGYGMDHNDDYRNVPYIGVLKNPDKIREIK